MGRCRKKQISFLLTNQCNLNCEYCYVNKKNQAKKVLDLEFAKKGLNDFFDSSGSRSIRFFAEGEPTLEFGLMKSIRDYAYSLAKDKLYVELQTNGFFTKEIAKWVSEYVNMIWISHDGPEANDIQRKTIENKPSSKVIEKNIDFLVKSGKVVVGVRATITPKNIRKQKGLVEFFSKIGVKAIAVDPVFLKVGSKDGRGIDLIEFADNFLEARSFAEKLGIFYTTILTTNFDEKVDIACQSCLPCPHLTPDGFVSACDLATDGETPLKDLIYGKYNKEKDSIEYFSEKIKLLQSRNIDNLDKCKGCEVLNNCAGGCLGETLNECGSLFGIRKDVCVAVKYLSKNMELNKKIYPYFHP